jgi:hypothetical protein
MTIITVAILTTYISMFIISMYHDHYHCIHLDNLYLYVSSTQRKRPCTDPVG